MGRRRLEGLYPARPKPRRALGPSRVVFGTDIWGRSIPSQLSRIVACDVPDADKERMCWRNATEVIGDRLPAGWREHFAS